MILLFTPYSAGVPSLSGHLPFNPLGSSSGPHAYRTSSLTNETSSHRPPSSSELLGFYCTEMFICSFIPVAFYILFRGFETSFLFLLISITEGLHSNVTFFFLKFLYLYPLGACVWFLCFYSSVCSLDCWIFKSAVGLVAYACHPENYGGRGRRIAILSLAWAT